MAAADDVRGACDAGREKSFFEIAPRVGGRRAVVGNKAAFGRHHDLVAVKTLRRKLFERRADGALASLQAVIDRAVDDVAAGLHGAHRGIVVKPVGFIVVVAEIGADADGGER